MARILIIDDDRAICSVVKLVLERQGHETVSAEDGRRGLKLLETDSFDLLIVDIFMPEMDGLETIRLVRQSRPMLPIVVMSGVPREVEGTPDYLPMARRLGATASLRKPFTPDALMRAVKACLEDNRRTA